MNCLESIVRNNQRAVELGVIEAGTAVGTAGHDPDRHQKAEAAGFFHTKGHRDDAGGLRGHSIGDAYPYSAVGGVDEQGTNWTVTNLLTGETFGTYHGNNACTLAHADCDRRKVADAEYLNEQQRINETPPNYNLAA